MATLLMVFRCLRLKLRGERFDLVFVPSSEQLPALIAGFAAAKFFGAPLVACNMNIEWFPRPLRRWAARAHNLADLLITLSKDLRSKLLFYGVKKPVVVNGVGLDLTLIEEMSKEQEQKCYDAIFVGRHDPEKGVYDLVEIWAEVSARRPEALLVTVGSCNPVNLRRLRAKIGELGLERNIRMLGVVEEREKFRLMRKSRICLFPSVVEGWGIVPQEGLACGLPVVLYDLPVYGETVRECDAVFLEPVRDKRAVAERVLWLLSCGRHLRFSESGPKFVRRFNWEDVARTEFEILESLASGFAKARTQSVR